MYKCSAFRPVQLPSDNSSNEPLLRLNGADNFFIRNIVFEANNATHTNLINFDARSNLLRINYCTFNIDESITTTNAISFPIGVCKNVHTHFIDEANGILFAATCWSRRNRR